MSDKSSMKIIDFIVDPTEFFIEVIKNECPHAYKIYLSHEKDGYYVCSESIRTHKKAYLLRLQFELNKEGKLFLGYPD